MSTVIVNLNGMFPTVPFLSLKEFCTREVMTLMKLIISHYLLCLIISNQITVNQQDSTSSDSVNRSG